MDTVSGNVQLLDADGEVRLGFDLGAGDGSAGWLSVRSDAATGAGRLDKCSRVFALDAAHVDATYRAVQDVVLKGTGIEKTVMRTGTIQGRKATSMTFDEATNPFWDEPSPEEVSRAVANISSQIERARKKKKPHVRLHTQDIVAIKGQVRPRNNSRQRQRVRTETAERWIVERVTGTLFGDDVPSGSPSGRLHDDLADAMHYAAFCAKP